MDNQNLKLLANNVRVLSAEMIQKAKSGHPGMPLGIADVASLLWGYFLNFNPEDVLWEGRDRFVLSAGHGSTLLYSLLHLFSYDLSIDDLKNFRQLDSKTPGHPEFGETTGVEVSTGPLGMGFANGVGLAISSKIKQARFDEELFNYRVFGIVGDGDLMEGISSEAASLAGHLKLGNLIYIYDSNHITIEGETSLSFSEDTKKRFESYHWQVLECDGYDLNEIDECFKKAILDTEHPSIIFAKTIIGFGSPNKANSCKIHGAPLGEEELALMKKNFGFEGKDFFVKPEVISFCKKLLDKKQEYYNTWKEKFNEFKKTKKYQEFLDQKSKCDLEKIKNDLLENVGIVDNVATRELSGMSLQILSKYLSGLIGGSADLASSNNTYLKDSKDIVYDDFEGKNLRFGVREHAMGAIMNAFSYERMWYPFCATFLVFSDYLRPAIRMSALAKLQTLFIFTHDSIAVGEDGPTHQPIEQIASLRLIPNLYVFRPADGVEVSMSYISAISKKFSPSALLFTRQKLPLLKREENFKADDVLKGGYIVKNSSVKDKVIIATGSEVSLAIEVADKLEKEGVFYRVVSMPCVELFLEQGDSYQDSIVPSDAKVVTLELGATAIWGSFIRNGGFSIGIDEFGASAPHSDLLKKYHFTVEEIVKKLY